MKSLVIFVLIFGFTWTLDLCGDWHQFKDIKCIKVLEKKGTEEEAIGNCTQLDQSSNLITIHSKEEQEFLNNILIKNINISQNCWIGMKYKDKEYKWIDESPNNFSNWADDLVKDGTDPCVQMSLINSTLGKWYDVSCKKPGIIVCQKNQEINLNILKNIIGNMQEQIDSIKAIIPIGFLYTQLPNQTEPQQLWPSFKWIDVSSDYPGLFFRVEGGQSLPFGQIQQANQSWINSVYYSGCRYGAWSSWSGPIWENRIIYLNQTGQFDAVPGAERTILDLNFDVTIEEVRPKNTAIKIWKRIQ